MEDNVPQKALGLTDSIFYQLIGKREVIKVEAPQALRATDGFLRHKDVFKQIIALTGEVDFIEISGSLKLRDKHYRIITVRQLKTLLEQNGYRIGKRNGLFILYNGQFWREVGKDDLRWLLGVVAAKMKVPWDRADDAEFLEKLFDQFESAVLIPSDLEETKSGTVLVNFKNGTFEITSAKQCLRGFQAEDYLTYRLPFPYDPSAEAPQFQAYLNDVLPDTELQTLLAESMGAVFIPNTVLKLEKVLLLYGSGANGKSVFFDLMKAVFGYHNFSSFSLNQLTDDRGYSRAKLWGKLINYDSEISSKMDIEMFKKLASGEPIEARLPYGEPFILGNYAKLVFNCNSLPRDIEVNNAFFRRFNIIPFNQTIPEERQDKELAKKIIAGELPGIFMWILKGLKRVLVQKGFSHSKAAEEELNKYRNESDSVKIFLEEFGYASSENKGVAQAELLVYYREYCKRVGLNPVGIIKFGKRLDDLGHRREKKAAGMVVYVEPNTFGVRELFKLIKNEHGK